ncbi:MAG: PDC sensor domain-containing protein, partial [Methanosarcinaceae archaeon]
MNSSSDMLENAKIDAENQAIDATNKIDIELRGLIPISESIANDLSSGKLEKNEINGLLESTLEDHTKIHGAFVAYKPYGYDSLTRLYAPYFTKNPDGSIQGIHIEDKYDYTLTDDKNGIRTNWYHQTLIKGSCWIEPYFGAAEQTLMVNYNVLFYDTNESGRRNSAGVVGTEYSLYGIRDLVGSLDLGNTGYGFILTEKGTIVSHPVREYLGKNIAELQKTDENLRFITENISNDELRIIHNEITGQDYWVFYNSIPSTNWTLGVVFVNDEVFDESRTVQRHLMILFVLSVIAFLFLLSILVFRADRGSSASLWIVVVIFSILCLCGMGFMWHLTLESSPANDQRTIGVFDSSGLEIALHKLQGNHEEPLIRIPTGIFIQSLEFSSANNVIITGYIWQDYSGISGDISRGFVLPEAESVNIKEGYVNDDVIGWYFKAV